MPIAIRLMGLRMSSFQEIRTLPGQRSLSAFIQPAAAGSASEALHRHPVSGAKQHSTSKLQRAVGLPLFVFVGGGGGGGGGGRLLAGASCFHSVGACALSWAWGAPNAGEWAKCFC